jgi:epoxide hydrolase-like predicted phosphatase
MTSAGPGGGGARAVICDFGGVLTTPLINAFEAYRRSSGVAPEQLGAAMGRIQERSGEHPLYELEKGRVSERDFLAQLEAELGDDTSLGDFRETYFENLHPNEPMIELMRDLGRRGLRMAMLTNNVREWEPHWRAKIADIDEIFEFVVDSAFVGMRKPEAGIYMLCVDRLGDGITPSDCVFVDDVELNCLAARELGMTAVHYRSAEQAIAEVEAAVG